MSSYTLSGSGTQALSANVSAAHITINTLSAGAGSGRANPAAHYDVALLRFGDGTGYWAPITVNGGPQWIGVPAGSTIVGYTVFGAASITLTEVIGGVSPFGGATPSLEALTDVNVTSISNAQVLEWDSASSTWKNVSLSAGAQDLVKISSVLVAGAAVASIAFASIPGTYRTLFIEWQARCDNAASQVLNLQLNGDTGAHYDVNGIGNSGSSTSAPFQTNNASSARVGVVPGTGATSGYAAAGRIDIPNYVATTFHKQLVAQCERADGNEESDGCLWHPASIQAITSITLLAAAGNLVIGSSATLYGLT